MGKKMKKNGFIEGAVIAYAAIIITKILGAVYSIPFYSIIGERGSIIYSFAYNIYVLFLDISSSGIPIAISIVISEYASKGMLRTKEKAYKLGLRVVLTLSVIAFLALQIFANQIGRYFISDMTEGVTVNEVAMAVRAISYCLIIVPFLSMRRGYLQGHKCMAPSSTSQVIEQFLRIAFVLVGSYLVIYVFKFGTTAGVCTALFGAFVGAAAALVYITVKRRKNKELFAVNPDEAENIPDTTKNIIRKLLTYCFTIVIVSVSASIYNIVDLKFLLMGLKGTGYSDVDTQTIASIASTWIPKICMIVVALAMGLTNSIAPHMAESFAQGKLKEVNLKLNQGIGTIIVASVPMATGIAILSEPVYRLFYGQSVYGTNILAAAIILNVIGSVVSVVSMAMQSIGRGTPVIICTIIGIVINAGLDLPLIYLFSYLGIPAYLGATAASIIGQAATLIMLLASLYKKFKFSYMPSVVTFLRTIIPTCAMAGVVLLISYFWKVTDTRGILLLVQLGVYALAGAVVYLVLSYKLGALTVIIDKDKIKKILRKLHLAK